MNDFSKYCNDVDLFYDKAFNRNIGVLTEEEQKILRSSKIAIAGCGGVGGSHLIGLVRTGIGKFNIADMDDFDIANIQRQYGSSMDTLGKNKSDTMKEIALSINPHLEIDSFNKGVDKQNIGEFLDGVDVLVDGIDFFCIETRRLIFAEAKKRGIYSVTAGPLGFGSALLVFSPTSMSFDEYFDINDKMSWLEKLIAFAVGLAPASIHMKYCDLSKVDISAKTGPALVSSCHLCNTLIITETLKILLSKKNLKPVPYYFQFDPYEQEYKKGYLLWGNRNPIQRLKRWYLFKTFSGKS
ncbi:MAG: ThiF family adenylyltransferase [Candidatus Omnitrophica bacterium]|nr:ThiF family adenylyltransferase [Candidatus Omnitrophota bacterium]